MRASMTTSGLYPLILKEPRSGVSKDEGRRPALMVRDGAARLLTMRIETYSVTGLSEISQSLPLKIEM
jgi:hypothetical protein